MPMVLALKVVVSIHMKMAETAVLAPQVMMAPHAVAAPLSARNRYSRHHLPRDSSYVLPERGSLLLAGPPLTVADE